MEPVDIAAIAAILLMAVFLGIVVGRIIGGKKF